MLTEIKAEADIRGGRIDLELVWTEVQADRSALRLVRRRRAYPVHSDDGLTVLDLADLFQLPDEPWGRVERVCYLTTNSVAEGGLCLAEVALYFPTGAVQPTQATLLGYNGATDSFVRERWTEVTQIITTPANTPWQTADTVEIMATPGGGPEQLVARFHLSPNEFEWETAGLTVEFDESHQETTTSAVAQATLQVFAAEFQTTVGSIVWRVLYLHERFNQDTGDWQRQITLQEHGLSAEEIYYYTLFAPDPLSPGDFTTKAAWRACVLVTGNYGLPERLYQLLPAVYRYYDEPIPGQPGQGPLRHYLEILGAAQDQTRGLAEGLRGRHDVFNARGDVLPHLARWLGWEPDQTLDALAQRNDILFAPEVYQTVGTLPNIRALVNRVTGWECRVKEFVHNVFLSNAPESPTLWEIWEQRHDGVDWGTAVPNTQTDGFDGRPAAVLDGANDLWLVWHSDRSGRREIWCQRQDGVDPQPQRLMQGAPDDAPRLTYTDDSPAVLAEGAGLWLFWSSNRTGNWEIWSRRYNGGPGVPERLTDHPADDRLPTAVRLGPETWLFWQSNRRGPTDIWVQVHDGTDWGLPNRLTSAPFHDEMPAAVVDGSGRLWLFWSRDLGDRRHLYSQRLEAGLWSVPEPVTTGPYRDEMPSAVWWNARLWLFWHSNRDGRWQIWSQVHDGGAWGLLAPLTTHPAADQETAAAIDAAGQLRLYWHSQRRGDWYKSRTLDFDDADMLARLQKFEDSTHYSYDTAVANEDWYARGAVGLYLFPDTNDPDLIDRQLRRVQGFVDAFRPVPVRFVWLTSTPVLELMEEVINNDGLIGDEFDDEIL